MHSMEFTRMMRAWSAQQVVTLDVKRHEIARKAHMRAYTTPHQEL
jgi:hypothetical protein